jgi:hypothetical protein
MPEYIGMAEPLQGDGSIPPAVRAGDSVLGRAAAAGIGIPQLHPVVCPVPAPLCMGIMFAPAGMANAVPGDAATASSRNMTAHALLRIMILSIFTIVTI